MTSKNSFWDSCRENHKRRIWVWIVAVLSQLLAYSGMTMIYLSRIRGAYELGSYRTPAEFQQAMCQAARDALGFSDNIYQIVFVLAAVIGMQGFSYLFDRRKVDMYHSVPVSKNRRFAVVYVNGLFIYLTANLSGLILGMILSAAQKAVNGEVIAEAGLSFVWHFFFFLVFYHMMILAVMLTGNRFVTGALFLMFALYEFVVNDMFEGLKGMFFDTYSVHFLQDEPKFSTLYDCIINIWQIKNAPDAAAAAKIAMPLVAKWIGIAAVLLALGWYAYKKRPSETAGKAVAHRFLEPVLKVAAAIPAAFLVGKIVYDTSYQNETLLVAGMLAGGVILCAAMEVIFDFDIRSLFKHLISSGIALAGIMAIFCIFKWDLFGYDSYIPVQNKVESIAISADGYYDSYWDENQQYIEQNKFESDHMFLTDTAPVLELAELAKHSDPEEMEDGRYVYILYRLKSGLQKDRCIRVDYDDPATEELLNQIFSTDAYQKGVFPAMTDQNLLEGVTRIQYTNGPAKVMIPVEEAGRLKDAWLKDMEQFDFTLVRHNRPCGVMYFEYKNYNQRQFLVYDCFENTISELKRLEAYYPMELDAADIESVTVTCYHNELAEQDNEVDYDMQPRAVAETWDAGYTDYTVSETFYEEEQIAQILPHLYCNWIDAPWSRYRDLDENYSAEVVFKRDTTYPYERDSYYFTYSFYAERVPEFVAEATEYTGESE